MKIDEIKKVQTAPFLLTLQTILLFKIAFSMAIFSNWVTLLGPHRKHVGR